MFKRGIKTCNMFCLGTPHPGLSDEFEGLGGVSSWGMGWDAVPQTYCRGEEAALASFCSVVRDEEFGLVAMGGFWVEVRVPSLGLALNRPQHGGLVSRAPELQRI